jgi:hypothetical protein
MNPFVAVLLTLALYQHSFSFRKRTSFRPLMLRMRPRTGAVTQRGSPEYSTEIKMPAPHYSEIKEYRQPRADVSNRDTFYTAFDALQSFASNCTLSQSSLREVNSALTSIKNNILPSISDNTARELYREVLKKSVNAPLNLFQTMVAQELMEPILRVCLNAGGGLSQRKKVIEEIFSIHSALFSQIPESEKSARL